MEKILYAITIAGFFVLIDNLVHVTASVSYYLTWKPKPKVPCTVLQLIHSEETKSFLGVTKSRTLVFNVRVIIENQIYVLKYSKTMQGSETCYIKPGDSFLVFADTKGFWAEDEVSLKEPVKKHILELIGTVSAMVISFFILALL